MGCGSSVPKEEKAAKDDKKKDDKKDGKKENGGAPAQQDLSVVPAATPSQPPPPPPAEDPNTPPKVLSTITAADGLLPHADLQLGLKVIGLVKGPLDKALKGVMIKADGRVNLNDWWFELRLEPRNRVIITAKTKQSRPDAWDLGDAMKVAKVFESGATGAGSATISAASLRAALEEFGVEEVDLEASTKGVSGSTVNLGEWKDGLSEDLIFAIATELDGIVDTKALRNSIRDGDGGGGGGGGDDPLANANAVDPLAGATGIEL